MKNILNLIFDRIYCINLDRRPDRWESFLEESEKFGLSGVKRYSAVDGDALTNAGGINKKFPRAAAGLVMTNIQIMEECIRDKVDRVLIMEGFSGSFIPGVLDKIRKVDSPLDVAYTDLQKSHNFYCFYPAVAVQRAGYSDIQNQTMDYSNWIK
jgi:hypothetical protein